ncbi:MAG: SCO family protein [Paracoccaceae bacterium]|jgi:protein SCO1/2
MLTRRVLLASATLASFLAMPLAALADHADLEPDPGSDAAQEMPRRYMMEDLYGNVITNEDFQGKFVLVYFGYTGCPDVCPTSLSTIADVLERLGEEDAAGVVPLFVSVDPERDTAKLMREYLGFFDERIVGLRGPLAYTDHMVKAFNARYEKHIPNPAQPDVYSMDHTASIAFLDPGGFLIKRYPHGTSAESMAEDMRKIIAEAKK